MKRVHSFLALVGVLFLCASPVLADGDFYVVVTGGGGVGTKITTLPYIVNNPGFYYLTGNLSSLSGPGITINADDVTIDLMGFRLQGNGSGGGPGIDLNGKKNVEIRNGSLTGWGTAIDNTVSANNHRLINLRIEGNMYFGIYLRGYSHLVKGCTISDNGSGITLLGGGTISGNVINNNVTGERNGINVDGYASITNNLVSNAKRHIYLKGPGSIIGNTVKTEINQTGIVLTDSGTNKILLDQNVVGGPGVSIGYTPSAVFGRNAGIPSDIP